jgi:hypothetical protein
MVITEIKVECVKSFTLLSLGNGQNNETGIEIETNLKGIARKIVTGDKRSYEIEMAGYMFSMRQKSFDEFMVEAESIPL